VLSPEWYLPGGQIVPTLHRSILHTSRGLQVPYNVQLLFVCVFLLLSDNRTSTSKSLPKPWPDLHGNAIVELDATLQVSKGRLELEQLRQVANSMRCTPIQPMEPHEAQWVHWLQ
jgi:hypothetical protein